MANKKYFALRFSFHSSDKKNLHKKYILNSIVEKTKNYELIMQEKATAAISWCL